MNTSLIHVYAVSGILVRGETFLIAERPAGKPYSGYWEFPGGKIEKNETAEQALKRELHEEIGIEVNKATFLFDHEYPYPDKIVHLQLWLVNDFKGEPHSKENQSLRWVTLSEMMKMNLLEGNWPIVEAIRKYGLNA